MSEKNGNRLFNCLALLSTAMLTFIFLSVLLFGNTIHYANQRSFLAPNVILFVLGELFIFFLYSLTKNKKSGKIKFVFWLLFFLFQCAVSYFGYFITGWDAGRVLDDAYIMGLYGSTYSPNNYYFSFHHNNIITALIESNIIRLFSLLTGGEPSIERCTLILIFTQSALCTLSGYLTGELVDTHLPGKYWFCSVLFFLFIGLNPWFMIPYTDGLSMIFPILILLLYDKITCTERFCYSFRWAILGIVSAIAYLIKPQAFIAGIAICIVHLISKSNAKRKLMDICLFLFIFFLGTGPVHQFIINHSFFQIDENLKLDSCHFRMVGLTPETNGGYAAINDAISESTEDPEERHALQMKTIHDRIQTLGFYGMMRHLFKKNLTNYGDGAFAWGIEGWFYRTFIPDKDSVISPFIKGILNTDENKGYLQFSSFLQCMWLGILFLDCWAFFSFLRRKAMFSAIPPILFAAALSIIGLTIFGLLFEARARYLYSYAPVFVLLSCFGMNEIELFRKSLISRSAESSH